MNLISCEDWQPLGNPEQLEREALEFAQLYGPEAVILHLAFNMERLKIEGWLIHRIASILMPGPWELRSPPTSRKPADLESP